MSKKLLKNFKAVNWNYINWFMTRKYISRLQARIYKAALKQKYGKMRRLQKKLLYSSYAKLLSLFTVLQYTNSSVLKYCKITQQESSDLVQYLSIQQRIDWIYASSFCRPTISENLRQVIYYLIQESQRILAELAVKPEWKARCFEGFYPFIIKTRSDKNVIAIIMQELRNLHKTYVLSLNFDVYSNFTNCLTALNMTKFPRLCSIATKQWLGDLTKISKVNTNSLKKLWSFTGIKKCVWPVQIVIYLFIQELLVWLGKESIPISFTCFKYNSQLLFLHYDSAVLQKVTHFTNDWSTLTGSNTLITKICLFGSMTGFEFGGYKVQKKRTEQDIIVAPAAKSRRLLAQYLAKVVKGSKHLSAYQLIRRLSVVITYWGKYFRFTQCSKTFRYLDYLMYARLWLWALKRHPTWNKIRIKQKYFLKNKQCLYRKQLFNNRYGFYSTLKSSTGKNKKYFLIRFTWFRLATRSRLVT